MVTRSVHSGRGTAAAIVNAVGTFLGLVLALHIIFVVAGANPSNAIVGFVSQWADAFAVWFRDLFVTGNDTVDLLLNYGLAAVFWLVVTGAIARVVRRVG